MQGLNKENVEGLIKAGFERHQNDELDDAENLYREALKLDTKNAEAYNLMGVLKLQKAEPELAVDYILKAISLEPMDYFYETLFQAYIRCGDYKGILANEETVKNLYPQNFSLLFDLALAFKTEHRNKEALKYYEKALRINPMSYDGWSNVANIYSEEGRANDAVSAMEICYNLKPKDDETAFFLAKDYFKAKQYAKGFPLFEKRLSKKIAFTSQNKTLPDKVREDNFWKGENIKNKNLLVYYEAGYGDALMYARYLPLAAKKCKKLTYMCHKELAPLYRINEQLGIGELVDTFIPNSDLNIDVHASRLSLPYLLGLKGDDIYAYSEGYIVPDMKMTEEYHKKFFDTDKIKVGIKWRGNTTFDKDRVIPAELFNQLIKDREDTQFYSFQTFEGSEDIRKLDNVIDIGKDLIDFSQTAAALRNLDLVICNDTSLVHLAGAMHIPCWVMLPYGVDWRWGADMSKCNWYDSVKLFRQKSIGDWQSVFDQILNEMKPE